ncbi:WbqC family protein [Streptomyces sp. SUK 48]|uniref:WbqC family protein n=1 Tax=Streptomyces sp. SUK 48 TaxID=2582831 RepID=UPI00129ABA19|nr:WbqC family protein [Streptomyces sp. SUK 48]
MIYIEQPPFAPWLGFCEALFACDTVALYDDVPYTDGGYQNRNRIKTADGVRWLTVPVTRAPGQLIRDTPIAPGFDADRMLRTIRLAYARTPHADEALHVLQPVLGQRHTWLADLNIELLTHIRAALGAPARLQLTSEMRIADTDRTRRLAAICAAAGCKVLWAGSGTRSYLDTTALAQHHVSVRWNEYADRHPVYQQAWPRQGFAPNLSVIDTVCALGWAGTAALLRTGLATHLQQPAPKEATA